MVVSISSKNNDHLQTNANNCLNSILCVPFAENIITGRKLSDEEIHNLAQTNSTNQQQSNQQLKFLFSKGKVIKKNYISSEYKLLRKHHKANNSGGVLGTVLTDCT